MSTLTDLLRGKGAHIDPIAAVEDLDSGLAGRRLPGFRHTIWQQLGHLNYWMDHELRSIEGPELPVPTHAAASWPNADAPVDDSAWQHELGLFRTNLAQLHTLAEAKASTLARIVHPKSGQTVEAILWLLAAHNSYHIGQIMQLRQALGREPMRGGVTW
jgi:uncharacterized damage-inducible protein DinB